MWCVSLVTAAGSRWAPVKRGAAPYGILVLKDLTPDEPGATHSRCVVDAGRCANRHVCWQTAQQVVSNPSHEALADVLLLLFPAAVHRAVEYASTGPGGRSGTGSGGQDAAAGEGSNPGGAAAKQEQEPPPPPTFGE